ncbi:MAG TPA: prephenate dehydrogenase [Planctomycetota bacterium]|nr:prephenate dehydrogenase [Planctomycetota bacterium]
MRTVAIVGLGQIGGSLAAALTRRRLARVVGVTRRAETARRARRMGLLAAAGTDVAAVEEADVVVLATPVRTLLRQIPEIAPRVRPGALLTDVGSTKAEILEAFRTARPRAAVVAGHPMAGNEKAGLDGVDAGLFERRPWTLIAGPGATPAARRTVEALVRGVGSRPVWMSSAREHDRRVAAISHVPYLISYALMGVDDRALRVCGNSFRDATRVAMSDPDMVLDFLLTNGRAVAEATASFGRRLAGLLSAIGRRDAGTLRRAFAAARARRSGI